MNEAELVNKIKTLEDKLNGQASEYKNILTRVSTNGLNDVIYFKYTLPSACRWALEEIEQLSENNECLLDEIEHKGRLLAKYSNLG